MLSSKEKCKTMKLGKIIGKVVSARKEGNVNSLKILVVDYLDENIVETGKTAACIDTVNAREGDVVLLCSSSSARETKTTKSACTDNSIVGIVDTISTGQKYLYKKLI
jgi:microcompartment protein CcmK/EutM